MGVMTGVPRPASLVADVAIIGAGPYGLSLAAHLRRSRLTVRVFGRPMGVWRDRMPRGMHLKSEPFASDLYDPERAYPLSAFYAERNMPYSDVGKPVPLDIFCEYGLEFQRRFVPDLDTRLVSGLRRSGRGNSHFELTLEDGTTAFARRVVVAVGVSHYDHIPDEFSHLTSDRLSHSATAGDLKRFEGGRSAVIGAGASAIDTAVALAEAGAKTHLITRRPRLVFHDAPKARSLYDRVRHPMSTVGPSWGGVVYTRLPHLFSRLPERRRIEIARNFLGPAPCWHTRERFERGVVLHARTSIAGILETDGQAVLDLNGPAGTERLVTDHVIAATGYRVDLRRLAFLDSGLLGAIRHTENTPILNGHFESSAPGLFFVGVSAANSFGPVLRFACGAGFTARRLSRHLERTSRPSVTSVGAMMMP